MTIHILQATKLIFFLILAHFSLVIDQFVGAIQRHLNPSGLIACHLCGLQVFLTNDHTSPCCNAPRFISTTAVHRCSSSQTVHSLHPLHPSSPSPNILLRRTSAPSNIVLSFPDIIYICRHACFCLSSVKQFE